MICVALGFQSWYLYSCQRGKGSGWGRIENMAEYVTQDYIVKRIDDALNCHGYYANDFWVFDYFLDYNNYARVFVLLNGNMSYAIIDDCRESQVGTYAPTKANTTRLIKRLSRFMAEHN